MTADHRHVDQGRERKMTASLAGKRIAVIGASRGLGRVIAKTVHGEGAHLLAVARRAEPLAELTAELPGVERLRSTRARRRRQPSSSTR
jgi:NAD(P)-dependent dehydrogenase (short-subunit alcohol dehydrogenase family)